MTLDWTNTNVLNKLERYILIVQMHRESDIDYLIFLMVSSKC